MIARAAATLAGIVGALSLAEYAFGWRLGIDELLFHERAGTTGTLYPNRMALNTAEVACRLAHTMKGGAASLGAVKMAEACKALEELAKSGSLEGASELVDALEQAFSDALDALNAQVEPVAP